MSGNMNSSSASPAIPKYTFPRIWHSIGTARIHLETLMAGWAIPELLTYIRGHTTLPNEVLDLARVTIINPDTEPRETDTAPNANVSFEGADPDDDPDDSGNEGEHSVEDRLHLKALFMVALEQEWVEPHIHWSCWKWCLAKIKKYERKVEEREEKINEQERHIGELQKRLREAQQGRKEREEETYRKGFLEGKQKARCDGYREEGMLLRRRLAETWKTGWANGSMEGWIPGKIEGRREMFEGAKTVRRGVVVRKKGYG
ncbi:hypothetical protein L211DRAFT_845073 [Terfezia boudieri ATCC MYA-4762]|uniref:Uncharacterized protein n=1 Tax=Terfezia boudieri ATCC MYA-4762 TaxID=1051890 RepID=A0A3N4M1J7_9PEZI|nr:hypothetical protein L211DRAFT_845073 [Terfezia boudieri ATCC MYA-4762]